MSTERGFSLAELLVAVAVLGLILAGVFTLHRQGAFVYLMGAARVEAQQNTRHALALMTRELRSAQSVTSASSCATGTNDITFVDQDGRTIRYDRDGEALRRVVNGTSTTLIRGVETITFRCYRADGTTTSTASQVRSIQIVLHAASEDWSTDYSPTHQHMYAESRVRLRNQL
jgi:prepilin-type N-terminal cleavage/methylation domain-containing protein